MGIVKSFDEELECLRKYIGKEVKVTLITVHELAHEYEATDISWNPCMPTHRGKLEDVTREGINCSGKFIPFRNILSESRMRSQEERVWTIYFENELIYDRRSSKYGPGD